MASAQTVLPGVETSLVDDPDGDYVDFYPSGTRTRGEFRCADCAQGVVVARALPPCPTCGEHVWERVAWRPFTRLLTR